MIGIEGLVFKVKGWKFSLPESFQHWPSALKGSRQQAFFRFQFATRISPLIFLFLSLTGTNVKSHGFYPPFLFYPHDNVHMKTASRRWIAPFNQIIYSLGGPMFTSPTRNPKSECWIIPYRSALHQTKPLPSQNQLSMLQDNTIRLYDLRCGVFVLRHDDTSLHQDFHK